MCVSIGVRCVSFLLVSEHRKRVLSKWGVNVARLFSLSPSLGYFRYVPGNVVV